MRMLSLFLAVCLAGCALSNPKPLPKVEAAVVNEQPVQKPKMTKAEWEKLTRDCYIPEIPKDGPIKPVEDVAADLVQAQRAALEECSKRLRKLRKAR